jgi:hypothetical protein
VILLNSVGLMARRPFGLIARFVGDIGRTPPTIVRDALLRGKKGMPSRLGRVAFLGLDIFGGILFNTPVGRNRRLRKSPIELARHNPSLSQITSPVILLHTTRDITDLNEVLIRALLSLNQQHGAELHESRKARSRAKRIVKKMSLEEKGVLLRRTLLRHSKSVRLLISKGTHSYPYQFPKDTAQRTLAALRDC